MTDSDFRKTLKEFDDLIEAAEVFQLTEEESVSKLKAKLRLADGTILWVREIRIKESPEAYSYYWLRPDESIIIGWDNAPHHRDISSFPHHKHILNRIESSEQRNLKEVLDFIRNFF